MKNKKVLVAILTLVLVGVIGGTVAYYTSTATFNNEFTTGTYETTIVEEFESPDNWTPGTTTSKKVNVKNNGSVEVAARAKYAEKWTAADGTDLPLTRDGESVAQFSINSNWIEATDGYYYYNSNLATGETSSDFISSVTFNPNFTLKDGEDISCTTSTADGKTTVECVNLTSGYAGAKYTLEITLETIQADQKWGYQKVNYEIGEEITIGNEKFNVIRDNGDTVTMLAQFNLDATYRQNESSNYVTFSSSHGWEYTPGPKEIDIQQHDGNAKIYVNEYVTYLQGETSDNTITGTLVTLTELKDLGCTINDDYSLGSNNSTCNNSVNANWLVNGQTWWTRSANQGGSTTVWAVTSSGGISYNIYTKSYSIRPVIIIAKDTLENL